MSDNADYYKKSWEKSLSERTSAYQKEIDRLRAENARYREALELIAKGDIAPSSIKHNYIDEAYQQIAVKALGELK